jgi:uncharacterized membrane protein
MINLADQVTAKTVEHIVANSNEIAYTEGDTSTRTNKDTVADKLTQLISSKVYMTEDEYVALGDNVEDGVEYNIYEE